jgi:hypothetical protein
MKADRDSSTFQHWLRRMLDLVFRPCAELSEAVQAKVVALLRQCAVECPAVGYEALSRLRTNGFAIRESHIRALLERHVAPS